MYGVPRVRAGAAVFASRDGFNFVISSVLVVRGNLCAARLNLDVLADGSLGRVFHTDTHDGDGACNDTAAPGDGVRVRIIVIRWLIHCGTNSECIPCRERCAVRDGDTRGVFGLDFRHSRTHAADTNARRGRERGNLRGIFCREGHRLCRELRILSNFRLDIDVRRQVGARSGAAENTRRRANGGGIHRGICLRGNGKIFICLDFAVIRPFVIADTGFRGAANVGRDDGAIDCAVERGRCADYVSIEHTDIV